MSTGNGVSTTNIDPLSAVDELIGNSKENGSGRIAVDNFARQLLGTGAFIDIAASGDTITKATWAQLSAISGARDAQRGYVEADLGTHVDPVTGETVKNTGIYTWVAASAAWRWLRLNDLSEAAPETAEIDALIPLIISLKRAILWLNSAGEIESRALGPMLRQSVIREITTEGFRGGILPLVTAGDRVLVWMQDGDLFWPGKTDNAAVKSAAPIATDGRSLHRFRAKLELVRRNIPNTLLKIGMVGDSWMANQRLIDALVALFEAEGLSVTATGFVAPSTIGNRTGISVAFSTGWTLASAKDEQPTPYGVSVVGRVAYASTASRTITYSGVIGTTLEIHHTHNGGVWTYKIDDAPAVTVTENASGEFGAEVINGLSSGPHTVVITTVSGICNALGVYATAASGIEINAFGTTGTQAYLTASWMPNAKPQINRIAPDLVMTCLGTNDYASSFTSAAPEGYVTALKTIIECFREAGACGVVGMVPALSNRVAVHPLSQYRDALFAMAHNDGAMEFFNLVDAFGPWLETNALNLWADNYHLNDDGAAIAARLIGDKLLHIGV